MLSTNIITLNINSQNVFVTQFNEFDYYFLVNIESHPSAQVCPCCGCSTSKIHDYRIQRIRDVPYLNKLVILRLNKRRYVCKNCNKRFLEKYDFLPRYHQSTVNHVKSIIHACSKLNSFKAVANDHNVSDTTVKRIFKHLAFSRPKLPEVLGIDEFKGNTNKEKYQVVLTDIANRKVLDILENRKKSYLIDYFKQYTLEERKCVKFFVMDMWKDYKAISWLFPNAQIIIDKYHYVRQVYWALDNVRKRVQKEFESSKRIYFKRSKKLLFSKYEKLSEENKVALLRMLDQHDDLYRAWLLKEQFNMVLNSKKSDDFLQWILEAEDSRIKEFRDCTKAFNNWGKEIKQSLKLNYTNSFTEGVNNKIKVIKRISYGFRNFEIYRKKILHTFRYSGKLAC